MIALLLQLNQGWRGNGLDLRYNQVRLLFFYYLTKTGAIQHGQHVAAVGNLHCRSIFIPIEGDNLNPVALQFDCNFFSQFTRSAQQCLLCHLRKRRTDFYHIA